MCWLVELLFDCCLGARAVGCAVILGFVGIQWSVGFTVGIVVVDVVWCTMVIGV